MASLLEAVASRPRVIHVAAAISVIAAFAVIAIAPRGQPVRRTLEGRVTDETGAPVFMARVCAVAPVPRCAWSSPSGDYRINGIAMPDPVIDAFASHYVLAYRDRSLRSTAEHAVVDVTMRRGGYQLVGVVRDQAGRPIRDAYVTAGDALVEADDEGRYAIWLANSGHVAAAARGYARHVGSVFLPDRLDFALEPEATLAGSVVDATTNQPAAGVHVTLAPSHGDADLLPDATTDADGRFRVTHLEPGVYVAKIDARHAIGTSEGAVAVKLGQHVDGVLIRASPAREVTGRVIVEPSGAACANPTVVLHDERRHEDHSSSRDDTRMIHVGGLMPGVYEVGVQCEHRLANAHYDPITIADHDVTDQRWTVGEGSTITGYVSTAHGALAGADILACDDEERNHEQICDETVVPATGELELHGLQPGLVNIKATAIRADGASASRHTYATINVPPSGPARIELVLEPSAGTITGRLLRGDGAPMPNVFVAATGGDNDEPGTAYTDASGTFVMDALANDYHLECNSLVGSLLDNLGVPCALAGAADSRVHVTAEHTTTVELSTPRVEAIRGRVIDERGAPITDALVTLWAPDQSPHAYNRTDEVSVGTDGSFVVSGFEGGTHTIIARRPGGGEAIALVAPGAEATLMIRSTGSIAAVVHGAPAVERFDVQLADVAVGSGIREDIVIVTNGRLTLPELPAGRYRLFVTTATAATFADVEVVSGRTTAVELELDRFVTFVGRVIEHGSGRPLAGVEVTSEPLDRSQFESYFDHAAHTDASGRFTVRDVERGRIKLSGMIGTDSGRYPWVTVTRTIGADAGDVVDLGDLVAVPAFDGPAHAGMTLASGCDRSVQVTRVAPDGPAAHAGIAVGDEITAVDGVDVAAASVAAVEELLRGTSGVQHAVTLARGVTLTLVI